MRAGPAPGPLRRRRLGPHPRRRTGRRAARRRVAVRDAADELAALTERETGKPFDDARGGVDAGIGTLVQYAELGPVHRGRTLHGSWDATDFMVPGPRGVVAVLTPWNDPVAVAAGLLGAALVTGNTVVHKPSERCPHTGRRFAELLAAHLPEGVLEILDGDGSVGAAARRGPTSTSSRTSAAPRPAGRSRSRAPAPGRRPCWRTAATTR